MNIKYTPKPGVLVRFMPAALTTLQKFKQQNGDNEAGGILLGREYPGKYILIDAVSVPCSQDRAGRTWFERSCTVAQQLVNEAWEHSNGERIYLGEWHSHPEEHPRPSSRDRAMIRNMFRESKMEIDFLLLIIIGQATNWIGMETGRSLVKLSQVEKYAGE